MTIVDYRTRLNCGRLCDGCGRYALCKGLVDRGLWCTSGTGKLKDYRVGDKWADGHYVSRGELDCMAYIFKTRGIKVENRISESEARHE